MASVAAVVMTYNEAPNVRRCLDGLRGFGEVYVVDSGSTDGTQAICREYGATVVEHPYKNHASQWQWALDNLPLKAEWVFAMDADFIASPELVARLAAGIHDVDDGVAGIYVRHYYHFAGGLIRFGGTKPYWLRLVRRARARVDLSDLVDFRFLVDGTTVRWEQAVVERNAQDDEITYWSQRQDKFALRLAVEEELRREGVRNWQGEPRFWGNSDQRAMWLRERWMPLPLFLRPVLYFFYRYFFALGFLDGRAGFLFHFLQAFWVRLLVDWKIKQLRDARVEGESLRRASELMLRTTSGSVTDLLRQLGQGG